ncbi:hypothetical protein [Trueperella pyogenes]|uniref:hypothetical protein n=1 Tax=Trueperella pyogenes TaxID=1661 RepID=UPI00345DC1AD
MSQKLTPFAYNKSEVRTITEGDQAWFVASDICDFFGVTNRLDVTHYFASYFATLKCNIDSGLVLDIF